MRMFPVLPLLMLAVGLCIESPAWADTAAEVEQLRAEVALLKMKLDSAEKKLAEGDGSLQTPDDSASRPSKTKPIADLTDILVNFPAEAQPGSDGQWSSTAAKEAEERLQYAVWGLPFQRELSVRSVTVKENPELGNDKSASPWLVEIDFKNELVEYSGRSIKQDVSSVKIYADEQRARRARKLEAGDETRIRATIVSIRPAILGNLSASSPSLFFYLRDIDIPGITK